MKEIRAYIQPFMLPKLIQKLMEVPGFPGISVSDCEGFGRDKVSAVQDYNPFVAKKRIEIFAPEELVELIFSTIMETCNTHQHGAGKVYIVEVMEGGRVSSGERGPEIY